MNPFGYKEPIFVGTLKQGEKVNVPFYFENGTKVMSVTTGCHCSAAVIKKDVILITYTAQPIPEHLIRMGRIEQDIAKKVTVEYYTAEDVNNTNLLSQDMLFTAKVIL